jgi:hypothetical protein
MKQPVSILELEEYLNAATFLDSQALALPDHGVKELRAILRNHRFFVFSWLLLNGVQLPTELVSDSAHPEVGRQRVDEAA